VSDIRNYTFNNGSAVAAGAAPEVLMLGVGGESLSGVESSAVAPASGQLALTLEAGAAATVYVLQDEPATSVLDAAFEVSLAEGASLRMIFVALSGAQISNRMRIRLAGRHAECTLGGLYLPSGDQQMNFDIRLSHDVPECYSSQLFKGILRDRAQSRFDGLIYVAPDAQKTEAYQANHNLLLSPEARAEARPQLEIYADDVKCSHGATVGRLNEDELFYMRSRGITAAEAARLQQMAFVGEVLEMVGDAALRERLSDRVLARL
jgi:Fe-S cluster assembly protein SufD